MGPEAAGWDWLGIIGAAGSIAGVAAILLHYLHKPDEVERWVEEDPEYRDQLAGNLRGAGVGSLYRDLLEQGLDWLDRRWDSPGSARALGVCIIIALCYAYTAFFIAWGVGGPGYIGGAPGAEGIHQGGPLLLAEMAQPRRGLFAFSLVAVPFLAFLFGRLLGRLKRQLKNCLCRRHRWRRLPWRSSMAPGCCSSLA